MRLHLPPLAPRESKRLVNWTPLMLGNWISYYDVWLDPASVVIDTGKVSQLSDLIGSRHYTQATTGFRPVKHADGSVQFTAGNKEHLGYEGFANTPDCVVFFIRPEATQPQAFASPVGFNLNGGASNYSGNGIRFSGNSNYNATNNGDFGFNSSSPHNYWVNGVRTNTHSASPHVLIGEIGNGGFLTNRAHSNIGGNGATGGTTFYFSGRMYMLGFRDTVLTTQEKQLMEGYTLWQAGEQAFLQNDHPYRFARPQVAASLLPDGYGWAQTDGGEQFTDDASNPFYLAT